MTDAVTVTDLVKRYKRNAPPAVDGLSFTVRPGEVFVPFHYGRGAQSANQHTWYARDPVSHQPQLKSSPVAVRRLSFGEPEPWLIERLAELNGENIEPFAARTFA